MTTSDRPLHDIDTHSHRAAPSATDALPADSVPETMTAVTQARFGGPEVLDLTTMPVPRPGPDRVLVEVRAAALNPYDWHFMRGLPYLVRLQGGIRRPKVPVRGADLAGVVVEVGEDVSDFAPGDRVFGSAAGSCAEFVVARATSLAHIPPATSFVEAAAIPMAGYTALQAVRDTAAVAAGDQVLVNGASGGVGTFAVQIARALGARVTAVSSAGNADLVRSLGAEAVIDYTTEDFLETTTRFDAVIDTVMTRSPRSVTRIMADGGRYALVGALGIGDWVGPISMWLRPAMSSIGRSQTLGVTMAKPSSEDLATLADMVERGEIRPVIDRTFPLADTARAMEYLEAGHARGKVVITV
jgi:NADPH:quinone reductase-like Zn-dependent oxidoreductase